VEELPKHTPSGEGSHLWLEVEKRNSNTTWVAAQLARAAGCAVGDVGYAGMKDRHALTTQWFSVPVPSGGACRPDEWCIPDVRVKRAVQHRKKLKRGSLKGNRFSIVVRNLKGELDDLAPRLTRIRRSGLPNYFGPQRFGHSGNNVRLGARWLLNGGRLPRAKQGIYLSAVRGFLFNQVLAHRLEQGNWDQLLNGDVVMLDGTRSVFICDQSDPELPNRCRQGDIHPTGPLAGNGGCSPQAEAAALEDAVLGEHQDLVDALRRARLHADRRSLRLLVRHLEWEISGDRLLLAFQLPPGAYATTVIDELVLTPA